MSSPAEYDSPWKNILNQFLPDFVSFCLPELAADIDWSRGYVSLDKELRAISRQQKTGKHMADVIDWILALPPQLELEYDDVFKN